MSFRLLIIDDQRDIRYILARLLEQEGWTVEEAASAEEALGWDLNSFDALILDYSMPTTDGLELATELRNTGYQKPISVYSGYLSEEVESSFRELGITCFDKSSFERLIKHLATLAPAGAHMAEEDGSAAPDLGRP